MSKVARISQLGLICLIITVALLKAPHVGAFFLADWLNSAKDTISTLVTPKPSNPPNALTLDSKIELAQGGDVNNNGVIDAGDTITFIYTIQNTTDKKYLYATLKTNIKRDQINFIHDVTGATGLKDDGNSLEFKNLRIDSNNVKFISFSARVNYFTDNDPIIATEPELLTEDNKSLLKSQKQQIQAKKIKKESIPLGIEVFKK